MNNFGVVHMKGKEKSAKILVINEVFNIINNFTTEEGWEKIDVKEVMKKIFLKLNCQKVFGNGSYFYE